jgi:hypothetical protein
MPADAVEALEEQRAEGLLRALEVARLQAEETEVAQDRHAREVDLEGRVVGARGPRAVSPIASSARPRRCCHWASSLVRRVPNDAMIARGSAPRRRSAPTRLVDVDEQELSDLAVVGREPGACSVGTPCVPGR